ncbi:tyrosine-type recombinase/integrase [Tissierella creatinophila]|uniref:Tyrosine recombinase XerD n=1 Tax=Tissierella creatinophila DSM 6911 TaxID=1123403 RepID=A0A1U7M599_TISCR|nr:tyrosine-type recombinase/integrase [Tissierella creatinophila]OLS02430.1 tyrosine recombinase XerD [Tissierella creatinophila DSM 6911]
MVKLLSVAKGSQDNFAFRNYIFCKLIASTGIRRQEAIDLVFDTIDFNDNVIKVKGKGNKERVIPIKENLKEELFTYLQSRPPIKNHAIFINTAGNRINASTAHVFFTRLLKNAGLDNKSLSIHKLRHSYSTSLVNRETDIISISKLLGHSDINTTTVYGDLNMNKLRQDANKLSY